MSIDKAIRNAGKTRLGKPRRSTCIGKDFLLTWEKSPRRRSKQPSIVARGPSRMMRDGQRLQPDLGLRHRRLQLPRQLHPHPLLLFVSGLRSSRPLRPGPGRRQEPDRPRRNRPRNRDHDLLPGRSHRHPRRHVPRREGDTLPAGSRPSPWTKPSPPASSRTAPPSSTSSPISTTPPSPWPTSSTSPSISAVWTNSRVRKSP